MSKRRGAAARLGASLLGTLGTAAVLAGPAVAQSCPNHTTTTVAGSPSYTYIRGCIKSFDGTPIVYNLFEPTGTLADHSIYTIFEGPGWGGAGDTSADESLIKAGYAEMTWDPRGFGQSGGVAEVDSPLAEGRDVTALINKVLRGRPEVAVDTLGENGQPRYFNDRGHRLGHHNTGGQPVVGMTGFSYGGGIEWSTAAYERRVKAMVPGGSWNDLDYSLAPGGAIKLGWDELLFGAGLGEGAASHLQGDAQGAPSGGDGGNATGGYDPMLYQSEAEGTALGFWPQATLAWFHQRSYAEYGIDHAPDIPILAWQGTVDTLFNLTDAWNSLVETRDQHHKLPLKLIAFCGGHVSCPTGGSPTGQNYSDTAPKTSPFGAGENVSSYEESAMIAWFNHYLRGGEDTGAALNQLVPANDNLMYQDQTGSIYGTATFPTVEQPGPATYVSAPLSGTLVAHSAPTGATNAPVGVDTAVTDGATNAGDPGQVTVPVITAKNGDVPIVGEGHVDATVTVNGNATDLFFRLIDGNTGDVIDLQTTPLRIDNLDLANDGTNAGAPAAQQVSLDLAGVSYRLPKGDTLELQVSTSTNSFVPNRGSAVVTIADGKVSVPTL